MKLFTSKVLQESMEVESLYLERTVLVDFYFAGGGTERSEGFDQGRARDDARPKFWCARFFPGG